MKTISFFTRGVIWACKEYYKILQNARQLIVSLVFGEILGNQMVPAGQGQGVPEVGYPILFICKSYLFPNLIFIWADPRFSQRSDRDQFPNLSHSPILFISQSYFRERPVVISGITIFNAYNIKDSDLVICVGII